MWIKRLFDLVFSLFAFAVLFPLIIIVAILIKLTSRGPALYHSKRIGQNRRKKDRRKENLSVLDNTRNGESRVLDLKGRPFYMLKFRTMVKGADKLGGSVTYNRDPRVTKIGSILRKSKLDELPSLIGVIKGEMSIVGPRPESPDWVAKYGDAENEVLRVKPGITGISQIKYRNEESLLSGSNLEEEYLKIMHDKLTIDKNYVKNWSFTGDCSIIVKTVAKLFT